jgi:hypothetical protein
MANDKPVDLQDIAARLERLESAAGKKDFFDKLQIYGQLAGALLIPVALAVAGYLFSSALAGAQIESEERREQASIAIAEASVRVSQADLIATFMRSLLSSDAAERELAIRAVLLALPDAGPELVAAVRDSSKDPQTTSVATAALAERRQELVTDVVSGDEAVQERASRQVMGFRRDPKLVDAIAVEAERQPGNPKAAYNAGVLLRSLPPEQLRSRRAAIRRITVRLARSGDARAQALAAEIDRKAAAPAPE